MKIMIIGDGKIGSVLAEQLSKEKHEVTLVDRSGSGWISPTTSWT
ncbi:MAG: 2-dehydropantoate 2-reductase N-terminal domain-containing protein [Oscillospiraceae bacterium]